MGVRDRVDAAVLHTMMNLPSGLQRRLAGTPVRRDGVELAAETQLMLRLQRLIREPAVETLPLARARRALVRQARLVGAALPVGAISQLSVTGAAGPLPARLYTPRALLSGGAGQAGLLVYFHGGGMTYGDLDSHDPACRFLAEQAGVLVLSVGYRLAPEHPFPAGVEDCLAGYRWAVDRAELLGADPQRIAVGGDSAGGYLAATTAIGAAETGLPCAFQLLIYPVTDYLGESRSRGLFADGFYLTRRFMDQCTEMFLPRPEQRGDPLASILRRDSFPSGLAPAYVCTAGFDPLRDEGEAYADLLAKHGVEVTRRRFADQIHGFHNVVGCGRSARSCNLEVAAVLAGAIG